MLLKIILNRLSVIFLNIIVVSTPYLICSLILFGKQTEKILFIQKLIEFFFSTCFSCTHTKEEYILHIFLETFKNFQS